MNWYRIANRPYGYWIDPQGNAEPVREYEHWESALKGLRRLYGLDLEKDEGISGVRRASEEFMNHGHIRVVTGDPALFIQTKTPTNPAQRRTLMGLAKQYGYVQGNFIDYDTIRVNNRVATSVSEFMGYLHQ